VAKLRRLRNFFDELGDLFTGEDEVPRGNRSFGSGDFAGTTRGVVAQGPGGTTVTRQGALPSSGGAPLVESPSVQRELDRMSPVVVARGTPASENGVTGALAAFEQDIQSILTDTKRRAEAIARAARFQGPTLFEQLQRPQQGVSKP